MTKKKYKSPVIIFGLTPDEDDPSWTLPGSGQTSGEDSRFQWDPSIDPDDIEMFWASAHDETDLEEIAGGDFYITYKEFYDWLDSIGGW